MSSIRSALERLDNVVGRLDASVNDAACSLCESRPIEASQPAAYLRDSNGNVVDVDFVAHRLDKAIETVEHLLGR